MAKAVYFQRGDVIEYTNTGDAKIANGTIVALKSSSAPGRIAIVGDDIPAGGIGEVHVAGVFEMPKASSNAIAQGVKVYWDTTNNGITESDGSGANPEAGFAIETVDASATSIKVKIG